MVNLLNLETTVHVLCIIIWNQYTNFYHGGSHAINIYFLFFTYLRYNIYSILILVEFSPWSLFSLIIINSSPTEIVNCVTFEGACGGIFQNEVTIVSYIIPKNAKTFKKELYKSSRAIPWSFLWTPMVTFVSPNIFVKIYTDP